MKIQNGQFYATRGGGNDVIIGEVASVRRDKLVVFKDLINGTTSFRVAILFIERYKRVSKRSAGAILKMSSLEGMNRALDSAIASKEICIVDKEPELPFFPPSVVEVRTSPGDGWCGTDSVREECARLRLAMDLIAIALDIDVADRSQSTVKKMLDRVKKLTATEAKVERVLKILA